MPDRGQQVKLMMNGGMICQSDGGGGESLRLVQIIVIIRRHLVVSQKTLRKMKKEREAETETSRLLYQ